MLFQSDFFYGLWLLFITECEFDNSDIIATVSIEWGLVSGVRTHRSVKWCLNPLTPQF